MNTINFEKALCSLDQKEKELFVAIILSKGNKSKAAEEIGMSRNKFSILFDHICDKLEAKLKGSETASHVAR